MRIPEMFQRSIARRFVGTQSPLLERARAWTTICLVLGLVSVDWSGGASADDPKLSQPGMFSPGGLSLSPPKGSPKGSHNSVKMFGYGQRRHLGRAEIRRDGHYGPITRNQEKKSPGNRGGGSVGNGNGSAGSAGRDDWRSILNGIGGLMGNINRSPSLPNRQWRSYPAYPNNSYSYPVPGGIAPAVSNRLPQPNNIPRNSLPSAPSNAGQVALINPTKTGSVVSYRIGSTHRSLAPGAEHRLTGVNWTVEFDRGGSFGNARYSLEPGIYKFALTANGWDLFRKTYKVTVDNSGNKQGFNYMVDGLQTQVSAGQEQSHSSRHPVVILFDRGDGQATSQGFDTGVYHVSISTSTGLYQLTSVDNSSLVANKRLVTNKPPREMP